MQFLFSSNLLKKTLEITISIIEFFFAVFYNSLTVTNETLHIVLLLSRHRIKHKNAKWAWPQWSVFPAVLIYNVFDNLFTKHKLMIQYFWVKSLQWQVGFQKLISYFISFWIGIIENSPLH